MWALDLRKQGFSRALWGYSPAEVEEFLDVLAGKMEEVYDENHRLREAIRKAEARLAAYRVWAEGLERSEELIRAKAEEVKAAAALEAEKTKESIIRWIAEGLLGFREIFLRMKAYLDETRLLVEAQARLDREEERKWKEMAAGDPLVGPEGAVEAMKALLAEALRKLEEAEEALKVASAPTRVPRVEYLMMSIHQAQVHQE